eukprot:5321139-Prymnesium_polylepis.1
MRRLLHTSRPRARLLHTFDVGVRCHAHPRKPAAAHGPQGSGEDAHFVCHHGSGAATIGVADGVGGAGQSGAYAHSLMREAEAEASASSSAEAILQRAWDRSAALEGRSTACVAVLTSEPPLLRASSLGDSGFWVLRRSASRGRLGIAHRSMFQQHAYNCPFQLGRHDEVELNTPADAEPYSVSLESGDVVLMATD